MYHLSGRKLAVALEGGLNVVEDVVGPTRFDMFTKSDAPAAGETEATASEHRFQGRCYVCGEKGHSARFCPSVQGDGGSAGDGGS